MSTCVVRRSFDRISPSDRSRGLGNARAAMIIAIDGPSGAGKSSVSRGVADRLGYGYLDTGSMYRAVAWWARTIGLLEEPDLLADRLADLELAVSTDPGDRRLRCAGHDVTEVIRTPEVSIAASQVSTQPAVRSWCVAYQQAIVARALAESAGVVVEGRDIATVVCPQAEVKIHLTADPQVRRARRAAETADAGDTVAMRDAIDSARTISPLQDAADLPAEVTVIDATDATLAEVIDRVCALAGR